jgi:hypothetical protein
MDRGFIERNDASRARLRRLVEGLTATDLQRAAGDWTVAVNLAHLAFWDRFTYRRWIEAVASGRELPVGTGQPLTDLVNDASIDVWAALDLAGIRAFVLDAAEAVDAHVVTLPHAIATAAQAAGMGRQLDRSAHRTDHLDVIEEALRDAGR